MIKDTRSGWNDTDWAAYFGCSEVNVQEYRRKLESKFVSAVTQNPNTRKYRFEMYVYDHTSSGRKNIQMICCGDCVFDSYAEAAKDANINIIQKIRLNPAWVKHFGMPARALQLLRVKEK